MTDVQTEEAVEADVERRPYTVVVGVSGTSGSPTALAWAQAQAQQNGGRVVKDGIHTEYGGHHSPRA